MKKLITITLSMLALSSSLLSAREVSGTVKCGGKALGGVIVSDGISFVETNAKGRYTIDVTDSARNIFVVTPSGYRPDFKSGTATFYQALSKDKKTYNFTLQKNPIATDAYTILAIGDPQMKTEEHFGIFAGEPFEDLKATALEKSQSSNVVALSLGDVGWDSMPIYKLYKEKMKGMPVPSYNIIGNHDHNLDLKGDYETAVDYETSFGPANYAFFIGKDVVIVLDNVVYDTQKKYIEDYSDATLAWVTKFLEFVPKDAHVWVAQHCPMKRWFKGPEIMPNTLKFIDVLKGRDVTVLSGHTHINNNHVIAPGITEQNVAALCGAWWETYYCTDGTPRGYKVIESNEGGLSWYYKPIAKDKEHQFEIFLPGESQIHPNAILVNIWDWDSNWKLTWWEDGKLMPNPDMTMSLSPNYVQEILGCYEGRMKKLKPYKHPRMNYHYFPLHPSQYAKKVVVKIEDPFGHSWTRTINMSDYVDVQGHRGGAGLMPENTLLSMANAIRLGVNTLELDLQISQDGVVVVSHDAYFHPRYATRPDGSIVGPKDPKTYIYQMPYEEVRKWDTGSRPSEVWPEKACIPAYKPTAHELIDFVENYTKEHNLSPMRYNIEVKSNRNPKTEGTTSPYYTEFVDKCMEVLLSKDLGDRLVVQCFDPRSLKYMHEKYPQVILSYLVDEKVPEFEKFMAELDFIPEWLSPHYKIVSEQLVRKCHEAGMKIVPWTPDSPEELQRLIDLKCDAIITNYPDRLLKLTRGFCLEDPLKPYGE